MTAFLVLAATCGLLAGVLLTLLVTVAVDEGHECCADEVEQLRKQSHIDTAVKERQRVLLIEKDERIAVLESMPALSDNIRLAHALEFEQARRVEAEAAASHVTGKLCAFVARHPHLFTDEGVAR